MCVCAFNIIKLTQVNVTTQNSKLGPWELSSGQQSCLLFRRSEFESHGTIQLFLNLLKRTKINKTRTIKKIKTYSSSSVMTIFCLFFLWFILVCTSVDQRLTDVRRSNVIQVEKGTTLHANLQTIPLVGASPSQVVMG